MQERHDCDPPVRTYVKSDVRPTRVASRAPDGDPRGAPNDEVHEAVRPCSQGSQYTLWQRRALSPGNPQAQRRQTRRTSASHADPMHLLLRKPGTTFATAQRQATEVLQNMQRAARLSCS